MIKKERAYKLHYELWDWLSQHPDKDKIDWPGWKFNGGKVRRAEHLCFLCIIHRNKNGYCVECPLSSCLRFDSLFSLWRSAKTKKEAQYYAIQIRDAVKKGDEENGHKS